MRNAIRAILAIWVLCFCLRGSAQTFSGAAVEPNGWVISLWFTGLNTNGTYAMGLGVNEDNTTAKLRLATVDQSYDTNGAATTFSRFIAGSKRLRRAYPNNAQPDEQIQDGRLCLRIALGDFIYSGTSNITLALASGLYTQGGSNTPPATASVTNLSTLAYQKPVVNWSMVPHQYQSNGLATLKLVAVGHGADHAAEAGFPGRPVRMVKFWATDGANFSPTNTVLTLIDGRAFPGDAGATNDGPCVVQEYATQLNVSGLTNQITLTGHAAVYPWIGDSSAVCTTSSSGYSFPHVEFVPTKFFSDLTSTFPRWAGVVATNGNDSNGAIVALTNFNSGSPPVAFATLPALFNKIVLSNTTHNGRSDASGSFAFMQAGSHNMGSATTSSNNAPTTWFTVQPFPGVNRSDVIFTNSSGSRYVGHKTRFKSLTISALGTSGFIGGSSEYAWFDSCHFTTNITDLRVINTVTYWYMTGNRIDKLPQGIAPYTSNDSTPMLTRANDFSLWSQTTGAAIFKSTVLGNYRRGNTETNGNLSLSRGSFSNQFVDSHPWIGFNEFLTLRVASADTIQMNNPNDGVLTTNGAAIIQNVIENCGNSANGGRIASIASSIQGTDDINTPVNNIFLWNNNGLGQRLNLGEAAGGTTNTTVAAVRLFWSVKNNAFTQPNTKHDNKYNSSGIRTNGWPITYGVNWSGNTDMEPTSIDSSWYPEYFGQNSFRTNGWSGSGTSAGWVKFPAFVRVGHQTADGNYGVGNGDYRLGSGSGLGRIRTSTILPLDLYGNRRPNKWSPTGAVTIGNPRYGAASLGAQ